MKSSRNSKFARALVLVIGLSVLAANGTVANAASKTITCYKGTAVKKVTGTSPRCPTGWTIKTITCYKGVAVKKVGGISPKCPIGWTIKTVNCYKGTAVKKVGAISPKCPVGWTLKKPAVTPSPKPTSATLAFSGTYKGKIAMLWSESDVQATSVTGSGTGTILGLDELTGTGSATPASQCDGINGLGILSGGGSTLKVSFDSSAKGCAEDSAAPTVVNLSGNAVITGGTGKFAGATGTLKVTGSFAIKSTAGGSSETSALTLTLSGNINTK